MVDDSERPAAKLFVEPPLSGKWILPWLILSLPVAALIRSSMHCPDSISECCTPFFVLALFTAVALGTWPAIATMLTSAAVSVFLFSSASGRFGLVRMPMSSEGEVFGLLLFFVYCALIIGGVHFTRQTFARYSRLSSRTEWSSGVIFSLEDGQAWASWPGNHSPVRLGPEEEVSAMMEDFIAQVQLGKHLNGRYTSELMQADR